MCFCLMQIADHSVFPGTFFKKHVCFNFPKAHLCRHILVYCVSLFHVHCVRVILSTVIKKATLTTYVLMQFDKMKYAKK